MQLLAVFDILHCYPLRQNHGGRSMLSVSGRLLLFSGISSEIAALLPQAPATTNVFDGDCQPLVAKDLSIEAGIFGKVNPITVGQIHK